MARRWRSWAPRVRGRRPCSTRSPGSWRRGRADPPGRPRGGHAGPQRAPGTASHRHGLPALRAVASHGRPRHRGVPPAARRTAQPLRPPGSAAAPRPGGHRPPRGAPPRGPVGGRAAAGGPGAGAGAPSGRVPAGRADRAPRRGPAGRAAGGARGARPRRRRGGRPRHARRGGGPRHRRSRGPAARGTGRAVGQPHRHLRPSGRRVGGAPHGAGCLRPWPGRGGRRRSGVRLGGGPLAAGGPGRRSVRTGRPPPGAARLGPLRRSHRRPGGGRALPRQPHRLPAVHPGRLRSCSASRVHRGILPARRPPVGSTQLWPVAGDAGQGR